MTLPYERTLAVKRTQEFLRRMLDRQEMPRIPLAIRQEAASLLKHYPSEFDMKRMLDGDSDIFAKEW